MDNFADFESRVGKVLVLNSSQMLNAEVVQTKINFHFK